MNRNELKMSLKDLRDTIDVNKKNWTFNGDTNCYAYALGLDIPEDNIGEAAFEPGVISNVNSIYKDDNYSLKYSDLLNYLYSDLEALGIGFKEIHPDERINDDEWKIALYTEFSASKKNIEYLFDYHFLRQHKNGIWYHKFGWHSSPKNFDSNYKIITNLKNCHIDDYEYKKCLSLKIK